MPPSELKRRLTHADYIRVCAHFALEDPEHKLEKEINFRQAVAQIEIERAERVPNPPP